MDGRKNNKGKKGNKGGRPSKAEEHQLIERLTPLHDLAMAALTKSVQENQPWAVKLFFEYYYGKPTERIKMQIQELPKVKVIHVGGTINRNDSGEQDT